MRHWSHCWPLHFPSNFVVNPLGAVPKKRSSKWRLIMHLSHPSGSSVNDGIDIHHFPFLRYSTVQDAMDSVMLLGRAALMAKLDVKSAFRLCPVRPEGHHLLGMRWQGSFFFDRVLPIGLRLAPFIFNCLADAIEWLVRQDSVLHIHHYLDDLFVAGEPASEQCAHHLHTLISLCNALGVPLAADKIESPSTTLEYLGILLDSSLLEARLSAAKLHTSLAQWSGRQGRSKQELLSLIGTLSFAAKVVPAGRTFLRRMIDLSTTAANLHDTISLSLMTSDGIWTGGLHSRLPGMAAVYSSPRDGPLRPTWSFTPTARVALGMVLTARGSGSMAGGTLTRPYTASSGRSYTPSSCQPMSGARRGTLYAYRCDNQAVSHCIASGTSHYPHIMHLLRNLMLLAAMHNFHTTARHIPGVDNSIADSLSRFLMQEFRSLAPLASPLPTPTPTSLPSQQI